MLLKEIRNIKTGDKEKVKVFYQIFTCIFKKFPTNVQLHDSIIKHYYIAALPTKFFVFIKCVAEDTLALNFVEEIAIEKDLRFIWVIFNPEYSKESKDASKNSRASSVKTKEKDLFDMDNFHQILEFVNG